MKKILLLLLITCNYFFAQSQNIGIGTLSPAGKLHVKGSADTSQLIIDASSAQTNSHPLIRLRNAAGVDLLQIHSDDTTNVFIGIRSGHVNNLTTGITGKDNTFIGNHAGSFNTTGDANTANGYEALSFNTTGDYNTATGTSALLNNTTGSSNSAHGELSLVLNTTGSFNTANGRAALFFNTTANNNTASGANALYFNTTGSNNTATGWGALFSNDAGTDNTANGQSALYNTTGFYNTGIGAAALYSNKSGNYNTGIGVDALYFNTTGIYNTAVGGNALYATTAAYYNTAMGYNAGRFFDNGYNNIFLGANTDVSGAGYYNVIAIGQGTICTAPSQVTMGNGATDSYRAYANWSNISDGRYKKNIQENVPGLDFINKLRPVTYNLNATGLDAFLHKNNLEASERSDKKTVLSDDPAKAVYNNALREKESIVYTGFVAQEVEATAKTLGFNFSGIDAPKNENDVYGLRYSEFVVPLVKAVQEQQVEIELLKKQNEILINRLETLEIKISKNK